MVDNLIKNRIDGEQDLIFKSLILVNIYFNDKVDKQGVTYLNHLYYVFDNLTTRNEKVVGLLHDIVGDSCITFDDLEKLGYPEDIINSLKLLTRDKSIPYSEYIDNLLNSNDLIAIKVKYVDMTHNLNKTRLAKLDEQTRNKLILKYTSEYKKINDYLKKER